LTCDVLFWSVVQVIVAPVFVIVVTAILVIIGAVAAGVVKDKLPDVADVPLAFAETTSKSYSVPAVKPDSVTE
jgi:hypothetical protein